LTAVVLDTHALVWLVNGDAQLSDAARTLIDGASAVWVSAITPWEIGMLVAKGRLTLARDVDDWLEQVLALPGLRLAALDPRVAIASTRLPGSLHGDPADRLIAATARHLGAVLVTADDKLLAWGAAGHVAVMRAN
jgi:PIN domain nuclease of toxin-antitoxin system